MEQAMTPFEQILHETNALPWRVPAANDIRQRLLLDGRATADTVRVMKCENNELRITVQTQAELIAELEYKLNEVSAVAVTYAKAIAEHHAKSERYRAALLRVLGAGDLETAVSAVQEALGHDR
jgi:hypothetical protein